MAVETLLVSIGHRTYANFFMPSRLGAYRELLERAMTRGYRICSVAFLWDQIKKNGSKLQDRYFVLRHDIDNDVRTAKSMWKIEKQLGIRSSYYFRLSTVDIPLMQDIELAGGEASYHYEELASVAKVKCLKTRDQIFEHMPYIRESFRQNLTSLRRRSGLPMTTVASHGDFVNRKLKTYNWEILKDKTFRQEVGVELEVYDEGLMRHLPSRYSDQPYPSFWKPEDPLRAIDARLPLIYVLVHSRHWAANAKDNFSVDLKRLVEGIRYSFAIPGR